MTLKKTINADIITPILAYLRLELKHKLILESIPREKENSRYSMIAYNPVHEIKFENGVLTDNGQVKTGDPLDYLGELTVKNTEASSLPFTGGAIGFVSYDTISFYEYIGEIPEDVIGTPDLHFFLYESYLIFDHKKEQITIVESGIYSGRSELDQELAMALVLSNLTRPHKNEFETVKLNPLSFTSNTAKAEFMGMVEQAQTYIKNGDMFQIVLSQRLTSQITGNPFDYYRNLRLTNPSNYLYFLDFGDYQIMGASPESLVSVKNGVVTTNPIAGTRPRGADEAEDDALSKDLLGDQKEVAEHRMLVDLGRNDIGKISKVGTVKVTKYMEVEYFRYVMHLTSVVKGELLDSVSSLDALKSTLPAGTVSGAPKIRAMQRIYELEKTKRGIYAGAIGYLSSNSDMDFAIALRTMVLKDGKAHAQAGAGIVFDSVPENEYQETLNKAKAMTKIGESNDFIS
ncbi:anthranilate synthase component I [Lactococcus raffinolactis]|uniref:anthranilate synthase component I n=1 Tax=Pseudolactococcus raffinolactis TaxID=1366 RepID=UPI001C703A33|nr:anthranilate synthase component I [Lactococcus raffinolactis]MBW9331229.1 anthranilate synthase component I [Lactococcus raffinolactis]